MAMATFTSKRERVLWACAGIALLAITATLLLSETLVGLIAERRFIDQTFFFGFLIILVAIVIVQGFQNLYGAFTVGTILAIGAVYLLVFLRMTLPEERSHLIEYSVVALFTYGALVERKRNGANLPVPAAILAIALTTLVGVLDECAQLFIPSRVFDWFDMLFNFLAALMAVTGSVLLAWINQKVRQIRS